MGYEDDSELPGDEGGWNKLINLANGIWMKAVSDIINFYTANIDGSYLEVRESTMIYYYKNAEEEHGNTSSKLLFDQIKLALANTPVEIV